MNITNEEFQTNKGIAKPPKPIPGVDDDELMFMLVYFFFLVFLLIFGVGIIPDILGFEISSNFVSTIFVVFVFYVPLILMILVKIFKSGKSRGYLLQSIFLYSKSNINKKLDLRNNSDLERVNKRSKGIFNIINNDDYLKKEGIEKFNNIVEMKESMQNEIDEELKTLNNYYLKIEINSNKEKNKYNKEIEECYSIFEK